MKSLLTILNVSRREVSYVTLLCLASGLASTSILYALGRSLAGNASDSHAPLAIFVVGLIVFIVTRRVLATRLMEQSGRSTQDIRRRAVRQLLECRFADFEVIGRVNLWSTITQDAEVLGDFWPTIAYAIASAITLVSLLAYLAYLAPLEFAITIGLILACVGLYLAESRRARPSLDAARDGYDSILVLIEDLLDGFKELKLDWNRRAAMYMPELHRRCDRHFVNSTRGKRRLLSSSITGTVGFFLLIACVTFFLPFSGEPGNRYTFAAVLLYLINPMTALLGSMPHLNAAQVAAGRITELQQRLAGMREPHCSVALGHSPPSLAQDWCTIRLDNVEFAYARGLTNFRLGPLSLTIERGTLTFIVGANGSGKSTLGKVLTGLYPPSDGHILLDDQVIDERLADSYRQLFAAIFSDYHLFEMLTGAEQQRRDEVRPLLKKLGLHEDMLSNVDRDRCLQLSQGQRRRLSLAIASLEDRPIYFFDEWAADQDPEFRAYFYQQVLPGLKAQGKTVIAITHDDRYFEIADRVVHMERGGGLRAPAPKPARVSA